MWGRTDLSKYTAGCATLRNCFAGIRGGAYSRPGTKFVGQAKQQSFAGSTPPRIIPFQFSTGQGYIIEIGDTGGGYARFIANGGYITEAPFNITAATQANPCQITVPGNNFSNGDWVFISGVQGMTQLNDITFVVSGLSGGTFTLLDTFGNSVISTGFGAYTGGGTASRIYTISMPYAAVDLPYLKYTQSADVMSLTLNNPPTLSEYQPYDLSRMAADNWTITATTFESPIDAPNTCTAVATTHPADLSTITNQAAATYAYCVTAVDSNGNESQASPIGFTLSSTSSASSVDISVTAGSEIVQWNTVIGASSYNIYKAPPVVWSTGNSGTNTVRSVPIGSLFGLVDSAFGTQWTDTNVVPDNSTTPPLHQDPFARGQILSVGSITSSGTFTQETVATTINTFTGADAIIIPVVQGLPTGPVVAAILENSGVGYQAGDSVTFTDATNGGVATAPLNVGPQSGTYPGVVAYFQERRVYANTLNNPDTYFMSQTGNFSNMDSADPPIDSDAIIGTPWAQQVNGVQWMVPMTSGLIVGGGLDTWLLTGSGGAGTPVTPASQDATAQETNGFNPVVPPIKINYELMFVQALGSVVRSAIYNFFNNTYTSNDLTVLSNHLFDGFQIIQWAWAQEPYKIVWAVRDDGILLSLTYLKEQDVIAWARHDTNGFVVSVAVASEPPVYAPYIVVQRYIVGQQQYAYYVERMDNRIWLNAEEVWAVDAGLALLPATPNATLEASASTGNNVVFFSTTQIFDGSTIGVPGQIIRMGGGKATVTSFVSTRQVIANITMPIASTPDDPHQIAVPAPPGKWSIGNAVSSVGGLNHLEGLAVTGLADGAVIPPTLVSSGSISLQFAASQVVVGLPFVAQVQSLPLEIPGQPTIQGKRKKVSAVTVRVEKSRGIQLGANQPNASQMENYATVPWGQAPYGKMVEIPQSQVGLSSLSYLPLFTGDLRIPIDDDWNLIGWSAAPGMVAAQQLYPLPMNILMMIPEETTGDSQTKGDPP